MFSLKLEVCIVERYVESIFGRLLRGHERESV
jgi:hypothetical protein